MGIGYMIYRIKFREKPFFNKYGPFIISLVAFVLIMFDPIRHVGQDQGLWGLSEYKKGCHSESFKCLSATGWVVTVLCTWMGFLFLAISIIWEIQFIKKVKGAWRRIK